MWSNSFEYGSNVSHFVESDNVSDNEHEYLQNDNVKASEFGRYYDTYDWVECESTSFPGKIYYFNLRSLCTTWIRPVSRNVRLPAFRRNFRMFNKDFTCDLHDSLIISSENEDYECTSNEDIQKKQDEIKKCKISDILVRLYYDVSVQNWSDRSECGYVSVCSFAENNSRDENSSFAHSNSTLHELGKHFLTNNAPNEIPVFKNDVFENLGSPPATTDFLEIDFRTPENTGISEQLLSENDVSSIAEQVINYSSSDENETHHSFEYSFAPRLPKIKTKYLLKDKPIKKRKQRNKANKGPSKKSVEKPTRVIKKNLKPTKIICEMYGTKTINFNSTELVLPPGVKESNLSDTSVSSSLPVEPAKSAVWDHSDIPGIKSNTINLSSESSSCSCSDCTCSLSSDTSDSTSSTSTSKTD